MARRDGLRFPHPYWVPMQTGSGAWKGVTETGPRPVEGGGKHTAPVGGLPTPELWLDVVKRAP